MHLQSLQLILRRHVAKHVKSVCGQGQMILAHFRKQLITENIIGKVYLIAMLKISIIQKDKGTIDIRQGIIGRNIQLIIAYLSRQRTPIVPLLK